MTKWIPMWIKCPIALLFNQIGRLPLKLVVSNMYWSFTQNRNCSKETKDKVYQKAQRAVYKYMSRQYRSCIDSAIASGSQGVQPDNATIWIFWWQGKDDAPYIVKSCISSICENAGGRPVCVVDSHNFQEFAKVPDHILKKLQEGKMSITHFSDYLRMQLLYENGGLWIDGSIFVQKPLKDTLFDRPIWTVRNPGKDTVNISNWDWTIGVMGGWKGCVLFHAVSEVLSNYWRDHDIVADYFMMDCIMKMVYDHIPCVKKYIQEIEPNNEHFYYFQENANLELDMKAYQKELQSETWLYKISWKGKYETKLPNGCSTFYGQWQRDFGLAIEDGGVSEKSKCHHSCV